MTLDIAPDAGPISEEWRAVVIPRLAPLVKPGAPAELTRNDVSRYLHYIGPERFLLTLTAEPPPGAPVNSDPMATVGPALWRLLEAGAATPDARRALAVSMLAKLPCGECRAHWSADLRDYPPAVETAEEFFTWQWERHNAVNTRKGKPTMSLEDARQRLTPPL